jgi:flavin-dependent dehydrogenase
MADQRTDVAIVGAGPAGASLAARLARAGVEAIVLERLPAWRWRAGGVFASPAAVRALERLGLDPEALRRVTRPIPAMRLETLGGAVVRLSYGAEHGGGTAVGFDRSALDPLLVGLARDAGADVRTGVTVVGVHLGDGDPVLSLAGPDGAPTRLRARIVVGADGPRSVVARAVGVDRPARLAPRIGLTYHLADGPIAPSTDATGGDGRAAGEHGSADDDGRDARMRILRDGYVGIAPVPRGRVNVGIVLGPRWRPRLRAAGAARTVDTIVAAIPPTAEDAAHWRSSQRCEAIAGAVPLGGRVTRRAGPGWYVIGDAAGFLDPFTGEGLHRALVSGELASMAIRSALDGRASGWAAYERSMRGRFAAKDLVTWLIQAFLARPVAFEYAARRLAARPSVRATMGLVIGDLVPASRGLDPRFLATLLAP